MELRAAFIGSFVVVATMAGCAAAEADVEPTDETSSALTQKPRLPFPPGHTWYICQSYVGFSHQNNRPFDIGWTKASCNGGNDDSGGKPIAAPGAGKITRLPNAASGGDYMCLSLTGGGSIVLGHVKPNAGVKVNDVVVAGQEIATVRAANDPAGQNAGIAHLHYEAFAGNDCYVGAAQPFTGAWRMQCAPDLPFNATYGFYNGTAITACAPDAGAADAGAKDADVPVEAGVDAGPPSVAPPAKDDDEPSSAEPAPGPAADDGCAVRDGERDAHAWWTLGIAALVACAIRRRRFVTERRAP